MSAGSSHRDLDRHLEEELFGFEFGDSEPPLAAVSRSAPDTVPTTGSDEEVEPRVLPGLLRFYAVG